jgi:hypothetical protein
MNLYSIRRSWSFGLALHSPGAEAKKASEPRPGPIPKQVVTSKKVVSG